MTARDALSAWCARVDALDVGDQTATMVPGGLVIGGRCWRCMRTESTTTIGLCGPCLSWCRCEDLCAESAEMPATSSPTATVGSVGT